MTGLRVVRDIVFLARTREVPFMAAAIAHYALVSILPVGLLALALATLLGTGAMIETVVRTRLAALLSESGKEVVVTALTGTDGAVGAGILSVLVAVWSGSMVFRSLVIAFAEVYGVESSPPILEQLRDAVLIGGSLILVAAAVGAAGFVVTVVSIPIPWPAFVGAVSLFVTLVAVLLPVYYVLTPVEASVRDVLPGTGLAAMGLVSIQVLFVYYARFAGEYQALGLLGAVLLFVVWLYSGGLIVLLGGVVNCVISSSR